MMSRPMPGILGLRLNYFVSLLEVFKSSLEELKVGGILKSYSFAFQLNNNYTSQEVDFVIPVLQENSGNVINVVDGVLQKFATFKKEHLSRSNVSGRFSDWEVLSEEAGLGINMGLEVGNVNQTISTVPKKTKAPDELISFGSENDSHVNVGIFSFNEEMSGQCNVFLDQQMKEKSIGTPNESEQNSKMNQHFTNLENVAIDLNKDVITEDFMNTNQAFTSGTVPVLGTPIQNIQQTAAGYMDFIELQSHSKDRKSVCDEILATDVNFNLQLLSDGEDREDDEDTSFTRKVRNAPSSCARKRNSTNNQHESQEDLHTSSFTKRVENSTLWLPSTQPNSNLSCGRTLLDERDDPVDHEDLEDGVSSLKTHDNANIWACCEKRIDEENTSLHKCNVRFMCRFCGKGFSHKASLDDHITKHTGELEYSCQDCKKSFASQWKLNAHMHTHREPRYNCGFCKKKFVRRSSCSDHEMIHNLVNTYACEQCGQVFKTPKYLKRHEQRHATQPDHKCTFCGLLYKSKDALKIHLKRHQSVCTLYCPEASCKSTRGFLTREDLHRHLRGHKDKFLCAVCGQEFKYKHHLVDHEQNSHSMPFNQIATTYKCQLCTKSFKQKRRLDEHVKSHLQQPDYTCTICGKRFFRRDTFSNHCYLHSEQRLFTCAECGKAFSSKSNLSSHLKKHDDTDRIDCHLCSATFKLKTSYDFHMQGHLGNFNYECSICKKQFVRRCHFNDHLRTHDTSRPHMCPTCGKTYKEVKHCRAHINRAHPNEFNLETLVASITPEDARVAEILCSESGQNMADIANILPSSTESSNKEITFL